MKHCQRIRTNNKKKKKHYRLRSALKLVKGKYECSSIQIHIYSVTFIATYNKCNKVFEKDYEEANL